MKKRNNITLISDPTTKQIHQFIADAHVNVLPTFQPTGIKLKLLSSLYNGRFCVVNKLMVENTGLEKLCVVADSPAEMKEELQRVFKTEFKFSDIKLREKVLQEHFSNKKNIDGLIEKLYDEKKDLFS